MNKPVITRQKHSYTPFKPIAFLLLVVLSFSACKTSKKVSVKKADRNKPEVLFDELIRNQVKADWMEARVKLKYQDDYQSLRAASTIKMRKDSVIWMNVRVLGFEAGRALITKDSVFVLMRLQKQYLAESLDYLEESYNMPANLTTLQNLLLGNPLFFQTSGFNLDQKELSYHLYGKNDWMESHYWLNNADLSLQKMDFDDFRENRKVNMTLENYTQTTDNQNFSYFRKLELSSEQTGNISVDIDFTKVDLNTPKNINFEIPERYTRID
jgi:hypothetical protein